MADSPTLPDSSIDFITVEDQSRNHSVGQDEEKATAMSKPTMGTPAEPFGDETNATVKYRTLEWWQAGVIMIAETISLGILSLPSVLAAIGLVPGLVLITGLGILATYTAYVLGQFKMAYPYVHNMADAGEILLGPIGREIFGAAQMLFLVFVMASHILTFSIMMNVVSDHGSCTIIFGLVGLIVHLICCLPRTLQKVSYLSIASFVSIIAAVTITMIGVGIAKPGDQKIDLIIHTDLHKGFLAVANIVFAYAGHVAFFTFISELKDPKTYTKALFLLQGCDTAMYLIVSVVIYRYAGSGVESPALSSASPLLKKVAYGVAIPTIVMAGVINGHVAGKYIYVRMYRGTDQMSKNSWKSLGAWILIIIVIWICAWMIAEAIPVFNNLLGLISALFASWFTYGLSGAFWLWLNKGKYFSTPSKICLTFLNILTFCIGGIICGLGLYASSKSISEGRGKSVGSFSCADNSQH